MDNNKNAIIILVVVALITVAVSGCTSTNKTIKSLVTGSNIAIVPLLLVFVAIVAYKVVTVI